MRLKAVLQLAVSALLAAPADAQERTPANAFEFVRANMSDGSWRGEYLRCEGGVCGAEAAPIIAVAYADAAYCDLRVSIRRADGRVASISVDLRRSIELYQNPTYAEILLMGPMMSDGRPIPAWSAQSAGPAIARRVHAALAYLAEACRAKGPW